MTGSSTIVGAQDLDVVFPQMRGRERSRTFNSIQLFEYVSEPKVVENDSNDIGRIFPSHSHSKVEIGLILERTGGKNVMP